MSEPDPQVVRHESADGWSTMSYRAPTATLRGLVRRYIGYREDSAVPVRRREVPTGDVTLILSFGPPITVLDQIDPTLVRHRLTSFVAPVDDRWAVTEYVGEQYGLEIVITPLGASRLLGVPLDSLVDQVVDLEQLLGAQGRLLVEQLAEQPSWATRFDVLDTVLPALLALRREPSPAAAWAWSRLRQTHGQASISGIVEELGCSHRYLVSEFRRHVGVPPKTLARVLRCQRAIQLLESGSHHRIASVAALSGYSDQAHLNRDFRQITGLSPTLWNPEFNLGLPAL